MSRRLIVRAEAEADITEAALWYESRDSGLGLELISEAQAAIARALRDPGLFPLLRESPAVRRVLTRRFSVSSLLSREIRRSCRVRSTSRHKT